MFTLAQQWVASGLATWKKWESHPGIQAGLKLGVTLFALGYIGWRLWHEATIWQWQQYDWSVGHTICLVGAVLLLPLNLGLEALKWQQMVRVAQADFSFRRAVLGVLTGAATGIFTPNRLGDYAGRVAFLPVEQRLSAAIYTFVSRIAQMAITLLLGAMGLIGLGEYAFAPSWMQLGAGLLALFGLLSFAFPRRIQALIFRLPQSVSLIRQAVQALTEIPAHSLWLAWKLSLLRGATFVLQYTLLLYAFGYQGGMAEGLALVCVVFLIKSFLPSIALAELGIRESVALAVMGVLGISSLTIIGATFSLYLVNLIFPALLGLLTLHRIGSEQNLGSKQQ